MKDLFYLAAGIYILYLITRPKEDKKFLPKPGSEAPKMEGVGFTKNYSV